MEPGGCHAENTFVNCPYIIKTVLTTYCNMNTNRILNVFTANGGVLLALFALNFMSCSMKSDEELLKQKMDKEKLRTLLDDATNKFFEIKWDTVFYLVDSYVPTQLHLHGEGKSKEYGNHTFQVEAVYNYIKDKDSIDFLSTQVSHKELGEIISVFSYDMDLEETISPDEFIIKLQNHRKWYALLQNENRNYAELANVNKTQIHFGMTEADYKQLQDEFKDYKQFERNFIDGLIGKGTYDQSRFFDINFAKGKLSSIEFCNEENQDYSYSNLEKYGKCIKDNACRVNRYNVYEMYYLSSLYNLKIYESTTNNPPTKDIHVAIYWNGWIKLY